MFEINKCIYRSGYLYWLLNVKVIVEKGRPKFTINFQEMKI